MKHIGRFLLLVILGFGLFAVVLPMKQPGATFKVSAHNRCQPVRGTINSVFTTQNCTSPIGLCTTGTITGAGLLDGTTTFVAQGEAPSAGMPGVEPPANLSYSGQLTIVAWDGTLVISDLGVWTQPTWRSQRWNAPFLERECSRIREITPSSYREPLSITGTDSRETCQASLVLTASSRRR